MLGVAGPFCVKPAGVNSLLVLLLDESTLISLTSFVTLSRPDLGVGAMDAAEMDGEELPFVFGTKTAAATLRALSAPLSGLEGTLTPPRAFAGELRGEAEVAERPEEN